MKKHIFFSYPVYASFVRNDEKLLNSYFDVTSFHFNQKKKFIIPFIFLKHLFYCLWLLKKETTFVSFFAGYSSFIPALIARMFNKRHIIILGGTDCVSLPEIGYGNFRKLLLGWFTRKSIEWASDLVPVSKNLIYSEYHYTQTINIKQGYAHFCTKARGRCSIIPLGYDESKFYKNRNKRKNTFLCIAQINKANYYRKGIDLILEIAVHFPEYEFTIVGNDGYEFNNLPHNVKILGIIPYEEIINLYSESEIYLQLSMMEGFPSAPCEAMLCECVPIVSNIGAMPEIVGDAGFILMHKSIQELLQIMNKAISSDLNLMGIKSRERIIKHYPTSIRKKLIDLINEQ
jgi:glycosyltransferase involved in cell wall biosynthesis